jgi:hypothetical protein
VHRSVDGVAPACYPRRLHRRLPSLRVVKSMTGVPCELAVGTDHDRSKMRSRKLYIGALTTLLTLNLTASLTFAECLPMLGAGFTTNLTPNTECHNKFSNGHCIITVRNNEDRGKLLAVEIKKNTFTSNPRITNNGVFSNKFNFVRNTCTEGLVLAPAETCEAETEVNGAPLPGEYQATMVIETKIGAPTPPEVTLSVPLEAT